MSKAFSSYRISIKVKIREKVGIDGFNKPIYDYVEHTVNDVLAKPNMTEDIQENSVRQDGHKIIYKLYIPAKCNLCFENSIVVIKDKEYNVIGAPEPYPRVPNTRNIWNQVVKVGLCHG